MNLTSRTTMYVGLVFAFFFVGMVLPLGSLIGAPISLVALAIISRLHIWQRLAF